VSNQLHKSGSVFLAHYTHVSVDFHFVFASFLGFFSILRKANGYEIRNRIKCPKISGISVF
jgi:hypothetical protein